MSQHRLNAKLACVSTIAILLGCAVDSRSASAGSVDPDPRAGVVFVVGGIGGIDCVGHAAIHALPNAGVRHEVRDFVWTHGKLHFLKDLQDTYYLVSRASELAEEVRCFKKANPNRPVYLVGKSAGAALVLFAAEQLPPRTLERIVLLSAAVSPTHDLRPAFRATRGEIVSFYSKYDWFILGWGTQQFGTADRVHTSSAGLGGFARPADMTEDDVRTYKRLVEVPWSTEMIRGGYLGGHQGTSMPGFLAREVAPWLK
ncbi:MAG: lysophospholipase [Gemmataceae bacterium]|nr:lysophospholipase [Gemmataceae bacterium]